ncbi:MAG TPA: hypothetical protein PLV68_16900, partial [Ilumatobacteraceae bacterium]|nr:hypothetical protein [Ilumatobacteraceae bacterium]
GANAHLIADVTGYFPPGSGFSPLTPARLADTRPPAEDGQTTDGAFLGNGRIGSTQTYPFSVANRGGLPAAPTAVALNVTVVAPTGSGFVTVWPCGDNRPWASSVNFAAGDVAPNAVITKVGTNGTVCVFASGAATHVVVDVTGYFD